MEVPEEELADLLVLTPLAALKIHGADLKSRVIFWSSKKLAVKSVVEVTFHLPPGRRRHFTVTGIFSTAVTWHWMPVPLSPGSISLFPYQKNDEDILKNWGDTSGMLSPYHFSRVGKIINSSLIFVRMPRRQKPIIKPRKMLSSLSVILGCHHKTKGSKSLWQAGVMKQHCLHDCTHTYLKQSCHADTGGLNRYCKWNLVEIFLKFKMLMKN